MFSEGVVALIYETGTFMKEKDNLQNNHGPTPASHGKEPLRVKLSDIVARKAWQVRTKLNDAVVKKYFAIYRRNANTLPPLSVADVGGTLVLVDGWHRLEALKRGEQEYAPAVIFKATEEEARWEAAKANLTHGLPLKARELRAVFKAYVSAGRHRHRGRGYKSYRTIAADMADAVSYNTIRNWMQSDFPAVFKKLSGEKVEEKGPWANNGAPSGIPVLTRLQTAKANLDAALNEARAMGPKERNSLIAYASRTIKSIKTAEPWSAREEAPDDDF